MLTVRKTGQTIKDRFIPALIHRDFRVMWFGHVAGESASWTLTVAEMWLVFTLAESNASSWVGLVMLATMLPWFVVPLVVGYLTDRYVRRNILILAYGISLAHGVILTLLVFTDVIQVWHVVVLAFVNGAARNVHMGAIESLAANLIPSNTLANGYALISAGYFATRLTGPALIAPLIDVLPLGWIFLISVGLYSVGLYLTLRIRTISTGVVEPTKSILNNVFSGFRYVYSHGILRNIMFLVLFHCTLVMSFETLLPAISEDRLGTGGKGLAYLHMMIGVGALLVSIAVAPLRGEGLRGRLFLLTAVTSSVGNIILGLAPTLPLAMFGAVVIGVAHTGFMTMAIIMIQSVTPDGFRGRVTSVYLIHAGGIMAFSFFANGALADVYDPGWILIISAFGFLGVMLISFFRPTPRGLYLVGVPVQAEATSS